MTKRLPPLNPLRAFEATARHGSLSKAAGELHVTHGAISHQIRALELSLGVKLFERVGQRLKLTAQGAELLPAVSSAFDGIAAATARMTRPSSSGSLVVSCVPALLSLWLIPRLGNFTARYPDVALRLIASNDPQDVRAADIDICVHYGDGGWTDCWFKKWSSIELFPVVSPTLINNRPIRTIRDLADHTRLHGDDGREWHIWLAAADALGLKPARELRLSDAQLSTEAAVHGNGVALGDTVTASGLLARGQLVSPFNLSVPAVDAFYVVCRTEARATPIVQLFIDWLFAEREEALGRVETTVAGQISIRKRRPQKG
ncbi:transcriptional regulator GcvA [Pseudaminobacter arsenicus]|uniref:Transcriptional regulator GcvA n=1 Tax=Borborobacter arsenicus TaxID=1851146 RepID=A0A432V4K2_9HYPH|nr:transcriptional regulator GcvA [Pseudaminobacter arsenicus]RUM97058.1 transcriptional regulator GcvA [Pseudaminobacter arsenicus]